MTRSSIEAPRQPRGVQDAFVEWERVWSDGHGTEHRKMLYATHDGSQFRIQGDGREIVTDNIQLVLRAYAIEDHAIAQGLLALRTRALANRRKGNADV